ncbi:PorP/SprF family type IX secretion system membrane protein [Sunxiuqinia sp. A32]|uniref:PorP/SprF family type IX secretion system membrane protein n=1 Tax=Sunxiuqinia sp. A32 TaxID=3461496 RepID=UPI004045AF43
MKHCFKNIYSPKILSLLVIMLICITHSFSQTDPVFTQYMNSMQTVNPAYAGMWDRMGFQVFTRQHYVGHNKAPLTNSIVMYKPVKNKPNGIGLNIIDDRIGYEKRLSVTFDYAFEVRLDWKTYLRYGLKAGFINFDNILTDYELFPDGVPDPNFQDDADINFMPNWGVGALVYSRDYYISLSIPQILESKFKANRNNYSTLAELRYAYLMGGYLFGRQRQIRFKPTFMVKGIRRGRVQADFAANVLFYDKFWIGGMYRTNQTAAAMVQFVFLKNLQFGYAIEYPFGKDIRKYQLGTHEFRVVYEYDIYKRPYTRKHYF